MKKFSLVIILLLLLVTVLSLPVVEAKNVFPDKPIRIINYVAPGGLMDITTRKFVNIAAKYTKAVLVVENKPGAGGLVGIQYALEAPADGYTIFAGTASLIAQVIATQKDVNKNIWGFQWISMLMRDPECVITSKKASVNNWLDVVKDAKAKQGKQIWVGPATGGTDHLMAMKVWDKFGISGVWIPFQSGPASMAALMGGQGVAYVGNPADIQGRPDLKIAVISRSKRLPQFPNVPTFKELKVKGLDNEIMWRGFAVKKGTPVKAIKWFQALVDKVTKDPEWQKYYYNQGIDVVAYKEKEFTKIIAKDIKDAEFFLKKYQIIK